MAEKELKEKLLSTGQFIDNEYLDQYCNLIVNNLNQEKIKYSTQVHHIIPKCYFLLMEDSIDNSKENIVNLVYKDHVLAHYYLTLSCKNPYLLGKLNFAFIKMYSHKNRWDLSDFDFSYLENYQELYEAYCKDIAKRNSGRKYSLEVRQKISKANSGKIRSQDTKNLISIHSKGIKKPSTSQKLKGKPSKSKGKRKPDGFGEKVSKSKKGIPLTEWHKEALKGIKRPNNGKKKGTKNNPNIINKRKIVLSPDKLKILIDSYSSGNSAKESGALVGISVSVAQRILKENNIVLRSIKESRKVLSNGRSLTSNDVILKSFKLYFNKDLSQIEIHNITGIGLEVFRLKLIEYGIQLKHNRMLFCELLDPYHLYNSDIQDLDAFVQEVKRLLHLHNLN